MQLAEMDSRQENSSINVERRVFRAFPDGELHARLSIFNKLNANRLREIELLLASELPDYLVKLDERDKLHVIPLTSVVGFTRLKPRLASLMRVRQPHPDATPNFNLEYAHIYSDEAISYEHAKSAVIAGALSHLSGKTVSRTLFVDNYNPEFPGRAARTRQSTFNLKKYLDFLTRAGAMPHWLVYEKEVATSPSMAALHEATGNDVELQNGGFKSVAELDPLNHQISCPTLDAVLTMWKHNKTGARLERTLHKIGDHNIKFDAPNVLVILPGKKGGYNWRKEQEDMKAKVRQLGGEKVAARFNTHIVHISQKELDSETPRGAAVQSAFHVLEKGGDIDEINSARFSILTDGTGTLGKISRAITFMDDVRPPTTVKGDEIELVSAVPYAKEFSRRIDFYHERLEEARAKNNPIALAKYLDDLADSASRFNSAAVRSNLTYNKATMRLNLQCAKVLEHGLSRLGFNIREQPE